MTINKRNHLINREDSVVLSQLEITGARKSGVEGGCVRMFARYRDKIVCFCAAALCAACMWVPAARDDFSVMGNDVFSNLIREGRYDKGDATKGRSVGFSMLDREKLSNLSQRLFLYKSALELSNLFNENGGECQPPVSSQGRGLLICSIERRWRVINIGPSVDPSTWADPEAAKLDYEFTLSPNEIAVDLILRIINITAYRQIKG